jgi:hypothetical protein
MNQAVLVSIGLAALLGTGYGLSVWLVTQRALRESGNRFMAIFVGGLLARLVALLIAVGLVVAFVPVDALTFLAVLVPLLLLAIGLEVWVVARSLGQSGNDR